MSSVWTNPVMVPLLGGVSGVVTSHLYQSLETRRSQRLTVYGDYVKTFLDFLQALNAQPSTPDGVRSGFSDGYLEAHRKLTEAGALVRLVGTTRAQRKVACLELTFDAAIKPSFGIAFQETLAFPSSWPVASTTTEAAINKMRVAIFEWAETMSKDLLGWRHYLHRKLTRP
jgi:hypothetical protein